jgi:hypothetical protein
MGARSLMSFGDDGAEDRLHTANSEVHAQPILRNWSEQCLRSRPPAGTLAGPHDATTSTNTETISVKQRVGAHLQGDDSNRLSTCGSYSGQPKSASTSMMRLTTSYSAFRQSAYT